MEAWEQVAKVVTLQIEMTLNLTVNDIWNTESFFFFKSGQQRSLPLAGMKCLLNL